jgi:hypothetical protein
LARTFWRADLFLIGGELRHAKHMPLRQEAQFLRQRARRLRDIAGAHRTALPTNSIRTPPNWTRADQLEKTDPSSE